MSIYDSLSTSLSNNTNISNVAKNRLYKQLIIIKESILDKYEINYNFDNISFLIENLKIVAGNKDDNIYYNKTSNSLILGKSPNDQIFYSHKALLSLMCQGYDEEQKEYNSGLNINIDGEEYGERLNQLILNELITINTGYSINDEQPLGGIYATDILVHCFEKMAGGAKNLIQYFADGNGKGLYEELANILGEDNAKQLYFDNVNIERLLLSTDACELKRQKTEIPKM